VTAPDAAARKAARATELRAQLSASEPALLAFLEAMKADFGAVVLYVQAPGVEEGREPAPGVQPYVPLPASTWPYKPGQSPPQIKAPRRSPRGPVNTRKLAGDP
jgi:hypothetical protein